MRLRTFIASDTSAAMHQIRQEMGDEAIIVATVPTGRGMVEVTAAVETTRRQTSEALPEVEESLEKILRSRLRGGADDTASAGQSHHAAPLHERPHSGIPLDLDILNKALEEHGTPRKLADALLETTRAMDSDDAIKALALAFEARFGFEPVPLLPASPIALVGLPGSGKTVTGAKLAARAVLQGYSPTLITTDTERTGAVPQSDAYARLLNEQVQQADTVDALGLLLDAYTERNTAEAQPCLIDTMGINPFNGNELKSLRRYIDAASLVSNAEPVLVMPATADPRMASDVGNAFGYLKVRRMIVTQLDVARRIGSMLTLADATGFGFAQISITPYLANGLTYLDPERLARLVLGAPEAPTAQPATSPLRSQKA